MSGSEWSHDGGYSGSALINFSGYSKIGYYVVRVSGSQGSGSDFMGAIGFRTGTSCTGNDIENMWQVGTINMAGFTWYEKILNNAQTGYFCTYIYTNNYGNYNSYSSINYQISKIWLEK